MTRDQEKQFLTSFAARDAVRQLTGLGLKEERATAVVAAVTEVLAEHVRGLDEGGLSRLTHAVKRQLGADEPSPAVLEEAATRVRERTGLSPSMAGVAVEVVSKRVVDFANETAERGRAAA